jgi:ABC-type sugar transport system ATPase subunit
MPTAQLLALTGVSKEFPGVKALNNVHFDLNEGEVHAIVGENGAGKSTLMKILSGIYKKDAGDITYKGKSVSIPSPLEAQKLGISIIHQELNLMPHLTVAENIAMPTYILNNSRILSKNQTKEIASNALDLIGIDIDINTPVADISIASKQLIAIARATNLGVKMLFMDEPTTALTRKEIKRLFEVVEQIKARVS